MIRRDESDRYADAVYGVCWHYLGADYGAGISGAWWRALLGILIGGGS